MAGPNIAMIVMDTARATDTVPADPSVTPTLAELADDGVAYQRAFTSAPWTLPSHASLFTGTYSSRHGAHGDHTYLDEDLTTLAEALSAAGYETVGVSSNTWLTEEFGFARGFESFYRTWQFVQSGTDLGELTRIKHSSGKVDAFLSRLLDGNPLVNGVNAFYDQFVRGKDDDGAERATGMLGDWLDEREGDRPFFCFANYIEPHVEYSPPREVAERFLPEDSYETAREIRQQPRAYDVGEYDLTETEFSLLRGLYRGELAYLDSQIAALRETLREAGEWEDTLLVICGDHGENIGDHGFFGHQYNVYDTLLHVPLIVHGPAFDPAAEEDELVQLLDLFPTLLDVAGVDTPAAREQAQGRSLSTRSAPRDAVFAEYVAPQPSMEQLEERFGAIPEDVYEYDRSLRAIRTDEYKYIRGSDGLQELYDVKRDPQETVDLAEDEPALVERFDDRIDEWTDSYDHAEGGGDVEMTDATEDRLRDLGYL